MSFYLISGVVFAWNHTCNCSLDLLWVFGVLQKCGSSQSVCFIFYLFIYENCLNFSFLLYGLQFFSFRKGLFSKYKSNSKLLSGETLTKKWGGRFLSFFLWVGYGLMMHSMLFLVHDVCMVIQGSNPPSPKLSNYQKKNYVWMCLFVCLCIIIQDTFMALP